MHVCGITNKGQVSLVKRHYYWFFPLNFPNLLQISKFINFEGFYRKWIILFLEMELACSKWLKEVRVFNGKMWAVGIYKEQ